MNLARRIPKFPTRTAAAVLLATFFMGGTALAIDQPQKNPQQQRAWLVGHLVTDMEAFGTFDGNTLAKVPAIVKNLTDDQVALLTQYYFLTRSKTEQDASLFAMQQQGYTEEQVNAAKAQIADLLTAMNDQIVACYDQFVPMPQPVLYVAQICYASVPGWCCHTGCFVPDWYYDNGCFVGPCYNEACSGSWAVPICNAYRDHGSHFYAAYHKVANTAYINRSISLAKSHADWFRHQGDWKSIVAHDRLVHKAQVGPTRLPAGTKDHVANSNSAIRSPHAPTAHVGSSLARKPIVHNKAPKAQIKRVPTSHPHAARAVAHVSHPKAVAHASRPRPVAHASHPRPAAHAQSHARSGGHSAKHR